MSTPSPLIPQGTFLEKKGKSHIRIAVFTILAIHVVLLGALLLQGCKRTTDATAPKTAEPTNVFSAWEPPPLPPLETITSPPPAQLPPFNQAEVTPPPPVVPAVPAPSEVAIPVPPPQETIVPEPPPSHSVGQDYVIVKGDSFYLLAKKFGVSQQAIANANPQVDPRRLKIGQKILIPPPQPTAPSTTASAGTGNGGGKTYTVKSGDTLIRIASRNKISVQELRKANNLTTDRIVVGQKLTIPAAGGTP